MNRDRLTPKTDEFAKLYRSLSEVNSNAKKLDLPLVVHLTNMAMMQLSDDWSKAEAAIRSYGANLELVQ